MKKTILLFVIILSLKCFSQRNSNTFSFFVKAGISSSKNLFNKYSGSLGSSYILGNKGFIIDGQLNYHLLDIKYNESNLDYKLITSEFLIGYSIESFYPFYFNFKVGSFLGIEEINNNSNIEPEYKTKLPYSTRNFNYGIAISKEVEYIFTYKFSVLLNFTQYINLNSKYNKAYYTALTGIKYYL